MAKGGHFVGTVRYGKDEVRYTRSKDGRTTYAILLGWPEGPVTLASVRASGAGTVSLLVSDATVAHAVNGAGQLVLTPPALAEGARPERHAFAFRLSGFDLSLHEDAAFHSAAALTLEAAKATLDGPGIGLEEKIGGRKNIGFWDHPATSVHWLVRIPAAGTYRFRAEYAAPAGTSVRLQAEGGAAIEAAVPGTGDFDRPRIIELGRLKIDRPGVVHLTLPPAAAKGWKPLNLWRLMAVPVNLK